jgi:hypothetical protein
MNLNEINGIFERCVKSQADNVTELKKMEEEDNRKKMLRHDMKALDKFIVDLMRYKSYLELK